MAGTGKHLLLTNCYNQFRWYPEEGSSGKAGVTVPGLAMRKVAAFIASAFLSSRRQRLTPVLRMGVDRNGSGNFQRSCVRNVSGLG
jgi:hypothetical protein